MSIFGSIVNKIFGHASAAPATAGGAGPAASTSSAPSSFNNPASATPSPGQTGGGSPPPAQPASPSAGAAPSSSAPAVDVEKVLTEMASRNGQTLDWQHSIVDLMKLLNLDSSLSARQELARELNYSGSTTDSAAMNIWLHKEVMQKLAANGGKVPESLKGA